MEFAKWLYNLLLFYACVPSDFLAVSPYSQISSNNLVSAMLQLPIEIIVKTKKKKKTQLVIKW